jgi:hypothetical protein
MLPQPSGSGNIIQANRKLFDCTVDAVLMRGRFRHTVLESSKNGAQAAAELPGIVRQLAAGSPHL